MGKKKLNVILMLWLATTLVITGCSSGGGGSSSTASNNGAISRPLGWGEDTHSNDAEANYDLVFPQGTVNRLDITISAEDWQAMLDDMTDILGKFGDGGIDVGGFDLDTTMPIGGFDPGTTLPGGGGGFTPEQMEASMTACNGLAADSPCTVVVNGTEVDGVCMTMNGQSFCIPDSMATGDGFAFDPITTALPIGDDSPDGGVNILLRTPLYVPCEIKFNGLTWWHVGIRFKGSSSLLSAWSQGIYKISLRLDTDQFEDEYPEITDQRIYGFKDLSLCSNNSDQSLLREKVAGDIFRASGVPAPQTAFYRIYLDHGDGPIYFGLYTMTELPGKPMLKAQFGDDNGNLYQCDGNGATFATYDQSSFEKETNKDKADWSDLEAVYNTLHASRTDAAAWRTGLEAVFDVHGFIRWLAVNTLIVNWDTYGLAAHNYYLYGDPGHNGRLCFIPWDNNLAFSNADLLPVPIGNIAQGVTIQALEPANGLSLGLTEVSDNWPLIRYLMDNPVYYAQYIADIREVIAGAFSVASAQARFQAAHDLIAPYVIGSQGEQTGYTSLKSADDFETALTELLTHVEDRYQTAEEFLATQ